MKVYTGPDGDEIPPNTPFTLKGIKFPHNWLELSTAADRKRYGIKVKDVKATPPVITAAHIKAEARRRILTLFPEWKQGNARSRAIELLRIRIENGSWTASEQAEADSLQLAQNWIDAVRSASDALEKSLPSDYTNDKYWPVEPL